MLNIGSLDLGAATPVKGVKPDTEDAPSNKKDGQRRADFTQIWEEHDDSLDDVANIAPQVDDLPVSQTNAPRQGRTVSASEPKSSPDAAGRAPQVMGETSTHTRARDIPTESVGARSNIQVEGALPINSNPVSDIKSDSITPEIDHSSVKEPRLGLLSNKNMPLNVEGPATLETVESGQRATRLGSDSPSRAETLPPKLNEEYSQTTIASQPNSLTHSHSGFSAPQGSPPAPIQITAVQQAPPLTDRITSRKASAWQNVAAPTGFGLPPQSGAVAPETQFVGLHNGEFSPAITVLGDHATLEPLVSSVHSNLGVQAQQAATTVHPPSYAPRVAAQLSSAAAQFGPGTTQIVLNPEELGRVRMTLTTTDQGISVGILAERPETIELMRRHIDLLMKEFENLGQGDVAFSFGEKDQNSAKTESVFDESNALDRDVMTADLAVTPNLIVATTGGLDLKL